MKAIIKGKRYDTAKAKLILKVLYPDTNVDQLWLTEKGAWLLESSFGESLKTDDNSLFLYSSEEVIEYLENAQYCPAEYFQKGMNSQGIVGIIEHYFQDKIEVE